MLKGDSPSVLRWRKGCVRGKDVRVGERGVEDVRVEERGVETEK